MDDCASRDRRDGFCRNLHFTPLWGLMVSRYPRGDAVAHGELVSRNCTGMALQLDNITVIPFLLAHMS